MRIFATAQECNAELLDAGWTICIASSEPTQAGSLLSGHKVAVVAAEPFPSKAFLQAAAHEAPGKIVLLGRPASASPNTMTMHHIASYCMAHQAVLLHPLCHVMSKSLSL